MAASKAFRSPLRTASKNRAIPREASARTSRLQAFSANAIARKAAAEPLRNMRRTMAAPARSPGRGASGENGMAGKGGAEPWQNRRRTGGAPAGRGKLGGASLLRGPALSAYSLRDGSQSGVCAVSDNEVFPVPEAWAK